VYRSTEYTRGIGMFAATVFVLTSAPRASVPIGPIPLYIVDILAALTALYAYRMPRGSVQPQPFRRTVFALLCFAILSEFVGMAKTGLILEPIYLVGRTTLAFLLFYAAGKLVRGPDDLRLVLKAALLGLIITSTLMILTSLPMTRAPVLTHVFGNRFLEPAAQLGTPWIPPEEQGAVRGRTLVGVSIMGATFVNAMWPLAALLVRWPYRVGSWRNIAMLGCLLAPMGVLMSYSRGPILGTILIVLAVVLFGLSRVRRGILVPVALGTALVLSVGISSQFFFFDRLVNRTAAIFEDPLADEREYERLLAYVEPFAHLTENPHFLFIGEGNVVGRSEVRTAIDGAANHALFAQAYYTQGMISALLYLLLILRALGYSLRQVRRPRVEIGVYYGQALVLCLLALVPWAMFGHAIVSTPRGAMLFFLIIGLLTSLRHFPIQYRPAAIMEDYDAYGRRAAV
jgi:hypothetical protein